MYYEKNKGKANPKNPIEFSLLEDTHRRIKTGEAVPTHPDARGLKDKLEDYIGSRGASVTPARNDPSFNMKKGDFESITNPREIITIELKPGRELNFREINAILNIAVDTARIQNEQDGISSTYRTLGNPLERAQGLFASQVFSTGTPDTPRQIGEQGGMRTGRR